MQINAMSDFRVHKAPTGIEGFDEFSNGGLPRGRLTLITGDTGCGKTIFGLQTLVNGARYHDEPGLFISFEESTGQISANVHSFSWNIQELIPEKLDVIDAQIAPNLTQSGSFDLEGLLAMLTAQVQARNIRRVAFDGIDALLMLLHDSPTERQELRRLHSWVREHELVGIVTAKIEYGQSDSIERFGYMHYIADCLVSLSQRVAERAVTRTVRIVKYRGSNFFENETSMIIGPQGLEIAGPEPTRREESASTEHLSTGVSALDAMLVGGYLRRSSVLITGAPGTAKSTLAAYYVHAACTRGERSLYISFDETGGEIMRNMRSVGLDLGSYVEQGLLSFVSPRAESRSVEAHLLELKRLIRDYSPVCVVIDPVSALLKAGSQSEAMGASERLLATLKTHGITALMTCLLHNGDPDVTTSSLPISTLADAWINLDYVRAAGERNRTLSIVKARGIGHSNQVRELLLSGQGVDLADVYTAGGEVLLGTMRWEKEQAEERRRRQAAQEQEERRRQLAREEAELVLRLEEMQQKLNAHREELAALQRTQEAEEAVWEEQSRRLRRRRTHDDSR